MSPVLLLDTLLCKNNSPPENYYSENIGSFPEVTANQENEGQPTGSPTLLDD